MRSCTTREKNRSGDRDRWNLISAWHPKVTEEFMETIVQEIEKGS